MYELGYAASIGKATVILTSDFDTLPSDFDKQYALKYNPKQVTKTDFSNELINLKKSVEFNPAENIQHKFDKPIGGMS
jgi:hypothetical protein